MENINELDLQEIKKIATQGYGFYWGGKGQAIKDAENNETEFIPYTENNRYIEGDNIVALKRLQRDYEGKIKMIYIDPPYNTGNKFIYNDRFKKKTGKLSYGDGRHSNWLNMMYPRLKLAKNLLSNDGAIFISIDDTEHSNLRKLCDHIFGEENFVCNLVWRKRKTQANLTKNIAPVHEFIICYAKNIDFLNFNKIPYSKEFIEKTFKNPDNDPRGLYQTRPLAQPVTSTNPEYTMTFPNGKEITAKWSCSKNTLEDYIKNNKIYIPNNGDGMPRLKIYLNESEGLLPNTLLYNHSTTEEASKEIKSLFAGKQPFEFPKPTKLIQYLISLNINLLDNDIILDFFSGSATTAHAIMQLNAEDGGNRKYIMVQLPEPTPENSEASKLGYKNICEIGKERIRIAGEKIKSDESLPLENREKLNTDFEVIKL